MTEQPEQPKPGPFDFNKWIRDALAKAEKNSPDLPKPKDPYNLNLPLDYDRSYYKGPQTAPEKDNWLDEFFNPTEKPAIAELPGETRQAIAQLYAQHREFQRVGFTERESFSMIKEAFVAICVIQMKHYLDGS